MASCDERARKRARLRYIQDDPVVQGVEGDAAPEQEHERPRVDDANANANACSQQDPFSQESG